MAAKGSAAVHLPAWARGLVNRLPLQLSGLPHSAGLQAFTALFAPKEGLFFLSAFLLPVGQPAFEFTVTQLLGNLGQVF